MLTKLTLSLEEETIKKAKIYASKSGRSLSGLIGSYLEKLTSSSNESDIPDEFKDLFGSVDLPADLDEKAEIREIMSQKHS